MTKADQSGDLVAVRSSGSVRRRLPRGITSAGVVLAATFAVLGVLPLVVLAEIGFAVAFGVLLDTLIVRTVLGPALAYDSGRKIWWPSKLAAAQQEQPSTVG